MNRVIRYALVACLLAAASSFAADKNAPEDPYKSVLDHIESLSVYPEPEWRFHADLPHPEALSLDDSSWKTVKMKEKWTDESRVLRRWIEIPETIHGYATRGSRVKLDLHISSQGRLVITKFVNGAMTFHGDEDWQQPIPLTDSAQPGERFLVAVRVDAATETEIYESQLIFEAPPNKIDPALLRDQIIATRMLSDAYPEGKVERGEQLDAAIKAIDFSALEQGKQENFERSLQEAQAKLEALQPWMSQFTIRAVGNSHIDMAWLWPWTETVEVVRNTFQSALDLMREYPDFKFTVSTAQAYEWMEEKYPDLFQQIAQRVKEGRWEVVGGMWVEPDLNMPDGESLTRQILVGKQYFQKKFGVDVKIGWNPDSFGYNWQLPQIYKKSGIDYFVTQKLLWAKDFTTFPYKLFWWESPDGSRLLTYFPHDYAADLDGATMGQDLSIWAPSIYGSQIDGTQVIAEPVMMHLYGVGDHGGGPTRDMLDGAAKLMAPSTVYPKLEFSTAAEFFKDLAPKLPNMQVPVWKDELYFQYHRGVFTTQSETKRRIRRSEETLLNAEKFASFASLYGRQYPQDELNRDWKRLLFDHFHDIMPGSGIAVNYLDAKRNLEDVRLSGDGIIDGALRELAAHVNTEGDGVPVMVFNSLSWPRTEVADAEVQLPAAAKFVEVVDSAGQRADSQILSTDKETGRVHLLWLAKVPAMGFKTYFVRAAKGPRSNRSFKSSDNGSFLRATSDTLENEFIRIKVDPRSGCMTSVYDKRSGVEALSPAETNTGGPKDFACGNLLQTFVDKPKKWDAWNIDADFEDKHWDLTQADEVKLIENGPLRAVIRVKKHFQNSTFAQDITLYAGVPRADVKMNVDWHEKHILLKVAFPLRAQSAKATFEIPYGSIERPTTRNTPAEKAEFEVPALRWADISDGKNGFSLLNDGKYGYDAKGNVLRLSLLRSPEWPDPHADEGRHEFTYSLYPHAGSWRDAETVRRGCELNYKLFAVQTDRHAGKVAAAQSIMQVQPDNVVVTATKKAEDSDALVVRFYEWAGKEGDVTIQLPPGAQSAAETDLMEKKIGDLAMRDGNVIVHTKPYEIKTVMVQFAKPPAVTAKAGD